METFSKDYEAFEKLREEIDNVKASVEDTQALQAATSEAAKSLPDDWSYHRHAQELAIIDKRQAEKIYREDLSTWKENGWALMGLYQALVKQGKTAAAQDVKKRFEKAWQYADFPIRSSSSL